MHATVGTAGGAGAADATLQCHGSSAPREGEAVGGTKHDLRGRGAFVSSGRSWKVLGQCGPGVREKDLTKMIQDAWRFLHALLLEKVW